jgi:nucleotide-binding universal stress UspA family protein
MRTIVVPVSFGANAMAAARYAADLALAIDAELLLVHVVQAQDTPATRPMADWMFRELRDGGYFLLQNLAKELAARTGRKVPISTTLEIGDVTGKLRDCCIRMQPFLVIMGAGESAEDRPGPSHTVRAMHQLSFPLLVIPPNIVFQGVHRVAVACDQEDIFSGVPNVLPFLMELHRLLGSKFEVVHVETGGQSNGETAREYAGWKKEAFGQQLHIVRGEIGEGISGYLDKHPADWLLVLPKKHALLEFHRRKAKEIMPHSKIPVISVHE